MYFIACTFYLKIKKKVNFIEPQFTLNILKCPETNVLMTDDKLTVLKCIKKKKMGHWMDRRRGSYEKASKVRY